jgi:hypothetical protein
MKQLLISTLVCLNVCASYVFAAQPTLSERQYRVIESLQSDLADEQFKQVIEDSTEASEAWDDGLGLVLLLQIRGQAFQLLEDDKAAITALARAYSLQQLNGTRQTQLAMQLGQLYLSSDQWTQTRELLSSALEQPLPADENHPAAAYVMLALAWQLDEKQTTRWSKSIPLLEKALLLSDDAPESWLALLASAQYQVKDYAGAENTLKRLIDRTSKTAVAQSTSHKNYWLQLASMQHLQGKTKAQLATLELADKLGILNSEDEVLLLSQLQIMEGIPERAARRLQKGLKSQRLESSTENQRRIAIALQQGRDYQGASDVLLEAAKSSGDASYAVTALQLLLADGRCEDALIVSDWLIAHASNKDSANAMISAGQCSMELKQMDRARVYFQRALKQPQTTNAARQWLDYLHVLAEIEVSS